MTPDEVAAAAIRRCTHIPPHRDVDIEAGEVRRIHGACAACIRATVEVALAEEAERCAGLVPHLEAVADPLTGSRKSTRHLYRVDQHVNPTGSAECRFHGGRCRVRGAK